MLNASFAQLGYYTEISAAQLAEQTDGLAFLLDEGLLLWLEKAGRPVAFIVAVPDISEFLMRSAAGSAPVEQLRLLATRSRYRRDAVLVIKGTVPAEQGRGYLTLLSAASCTATCAPAATGRCAAPSSNGTTRRPPRSTAGPAAGRCTATPSTRGRR